MNGLLLRTSYLFLNILQLMKVSLKWFAQAPELTPFGPGYLIHWVLKHSLDWVQRVSSIHTGTSILLHKLKEKEVFDDEKKDYFTLLYCFQAIVFVYDTYRYIYV